MPTVLDEADASYQHVNGKGQRACQRSEGHRQNAEKYGSHDTDLLHPDHASLRSSYCGGRAQTSSEDIFVQFNSFCVERLLVVVLYFNDPCLARFDQQ
jgi:hypothetical protein